MYLHSSSNSHQNRLQHLNSRLLKPLFRCTPEMGSAMKPAKLLLSADKPTPLTVRGSNRLAGNGVIVSKRLIESRALTSVHELPCEFDLYKTQFGFYRLAPDNPFLTPAQLSRIDSRGCIPEGSIVNEGDILASIVNVKFPFKGEPPVPAGMQRVCNDSLEVAPGWSRSRVQTVKVLSRRELPRSTPASIAGRIDVLLVREQDLAIGDVLIISNHEVGLVSKFRDIGDVDIELDALGTRLAGLESGEIRTLAVSKGEETSADVLHVRGIGPYSLISCRPLGGKSRCGGHEVQTEQLGWLREHGMVANLSELTSLKSDDLSSRTELRKAYEANANFPSAGMPETLRQLEVYLWAVGLFPTIASHGDHVDITVRPARRDDLLARSSGQITKPETLNYLSFKAVEGGLFCERTFGPEKGSRRTRFGHLKLVNPVVSFLWRMGETPILARLMAPLRLSKTEIEQIVRSEVRVIRQSNDGKIDLVSTKDTIPEKDIQNLGCGGRAIRALLESIPPDQLPASMRDYVLDLVQDIVLVIPPDYRPLVALQSGNWATSDLNDLYRIIVNRNNRLSKLIDLKAPEAIILNESCELQKVCDALHANALVADENVQLSEGRRLVDLSNLICGYAGNDWLNKRVDFSAHARAVCDADLDPTVALIPARVLSKLKAPLEQPLLITTHGQPRFVALRPKPHAADAVSLPPRAWNALRLESSVTNSVILHRPLSDKACAEATALLQNQAQVERIDSQPSWVDARPDAILPQLMESVVAQATAHLNTPRGLLIGGTGSVRRADEPPTPAQLAASETGDSVLDEKHRLIPAPPEPPRSLVDLDKRIREVIEENRRTVCVFEPTWSTDAPKPADGSFGKLPWLPRAFEWPTSGNERLQCVAQLPLDAALDAGILTLPSAAGSLLSVFWGEDWYEQRPASKPIVQLLKITNDLEQYCVETDRSATQQRKRYLILKPVIREELPTWPEMADILRSELSLEDAELKSFKKKSWKDDDEPSSGLKIGGWPVWIQGVESTDPLLVQVPSNEDAGLMFGDSGRLYVLGEVEGSHQIIMQYY